MKPILVSALFLIGSCLFASQEPAWPPNSSECGESVLALYDEGPNFANVMQVYPEHLWHGATVGLPGPQPPDFAATAGK